MFDIDYFIKIFENLSDRHCKAKSILSDYRERCSAADGLCDETCIQPIGTVDDAEENSLRKLFWLYGPDTLPRVLRGLVRGYENLTPKQRMMKALQEIKKNLEESRGA